MGDGTLTETRSTNSERPLLAGDRLRGRPARGLRWFGPSWRWINHVLFGLRQRKISVGFFVLGTLWYALAAAWLWSGDWQSFYRTEAITLVVLAWMCSAVTIFLPSLARFAVFHGLRLAVTLLLVNLLEGRAALTEAVLLLAVIPETVLSLKPRWAGAVILGLGTVVAALDLGHLLRAGAAGTAFHLSWIILLFGSFAVTGLILMHYREAIVGMNRREKELDLAVKSLESALRSYQDYTEKIERASEESERNRITREIHDTIGYALTNIGMLVQAARMIARQDPHKVDELLGNVREQAQAALLESRKILKQLRETDRAGPKGLQALWHMVNSLKEATGIRISISYGNAPFSFGERIDSAVFRLVQEGITNAIKHGSATEIRILLWLTDTELRIRVWNRGQLSGTVKDGIGLAGMKERFAQFGGRVEASGVIDGFLLSASVPIGELHDETA